MKKIEITTDMMVKYMSYLRLEYDKLCESEDTTIKQKAYRQVCKQLFDGLSYGMNKYKLEVLHDRIKEYTIEKKL